ncbi:hypothetical protein FE257_004402 [Aspergillus nanangensis]|uniref:Uncharacterized protein n=1 Tax=Aspergillus nanangensis TaxID=2582783 RepID=A0AAD4CXY8_ASPNN|nr:hypothetical protein FE257_004402 [Aspergillus nanangensis]
MVWNAQDFMDTVLAVIDLLSTNAVGFLIRFEIAEDARPAGMNPVAWSFGRMALEDACADRVSCADMIGRIFWEEYGVCIPFCLAVSLCGWATNAHSSEEASPSHAQHQTRLEARLERIEEMLDRVWAHINNSKIVHPTQPLIPRLDSSEYDQTGPTMEAIQQSFPKTALDFHRLQYPEHWPKLKDLLVGYQLESQLLSDAEDPPYQSYGFDRWDQHHYRFEVVQKAIMARPFRALVILGTHIGVNVFALQELMNTCDADTARCCHRYDMDYGRYAGADVILQQLTNVDWLANPPLYQGLIQALYGLQEAGRRESESESGSDVGSCASSGAVVEGGDSDDGVFSCEGSV